MSVEDLRPAVVEILQRSDLTQVSSKAVRATLAQQYAIPPGIDMRGEHKAAITDLIKDCFQAVSQGSTAAQQVSLPVSLPGTGGVRGGLPHAVEEQKPDLKSKKKRATKEVSEDASPPSKATKAKKEPKKKKAKSSADPDTPKKKRPVNPNNPFNRPLILDEPLREICGVEEAARWEITRLLWVYIKGNNLQDPNHKRTILCDDKLKACFGKDSMDSFEIAKLLGQHVTKKPMPPGGFPVEKAEDGEDEAEA